MIVFFLSAFALWLLLTQNLQPLSVGAGLVVSLLATFLFGRRFATEQVKFLQPKRYWGFLKYLISLIYHMVLANIDVSYRVLHPARPINPGIVRIKTQLKTDVARTFLANSITLTPGTLTVEISGDTLYIHWIDVKSQDELEAKKKIVRNFEKYLKEVFE